MLVKRVLSAVILIPVALAAVYFGGIPLAIVTLIAALLAGYEYLDMMRRIDLHPSRLFGLAFIAALVADAAWPEQGILPIALVVFVIATLTHAVTRRNMPGSLQSWALVLAGGLYIGYMAGFVLRLRALENGIAWLALALVSTWVSDTGAYFVGCSIGKRPFFPHISPKRRWKGLGAMVTGIAVVLVMGWLCSA